MRPRTLLISLLALLLCALCGGAVAALAHADTATPSPSPSGSPSCTVSPSPSPSGSPSASPTASPQLVAWATHWRTMAARDRKHVDRLRTCLERHCARPLPRRPLLTDAAGPWQRYGRTLRRLARCWVKERPRDLCAILHPKLISAASWKPLLRFVGWPETAIPDAITCMRRESGGRPAAYNPSGCAGLFQLARCWWAGKFNPFRPLANALCALHIWLREGWRPWVTM